MALGYTLLVPVEMAMSGASGHPRATSRAVPSPPRAITAPTCSFQKRRAAAMVSKRDPVRGSSTISITQSRRAPLESRPDRSSPSAARSASRWRSGINRMRVAPDSAAATIARRTIPTFVTSEVWVAGVTSRRMSLPALGLTMMPTVDMGVDQTRAITSRTPCTMVLAFGM